MNRKSRFCIQTALMAKFRFATVFKAHGDKGIAIEPYESRIYKTFRENHNIIMQYDIKKFGGGIMYLIYKYSFTIDLDRRLSKNITFNDLYFSSTAIDCFKGNLTMCYESTLDLGSRYNRPLYYCGHHSASNVYF